MGKKKPPAPAELRNNPFAALAPAGTKPATVEKTPASPSEPAPIAFGPKVVVRREKKGRGGKTVTRLSGITGDALEDLAKRMKKALGCGAVVEGDDIVLLGSLVDRAADWLEAQGAKRVVRGN